MAGKGSGNKQGDGLPEQILPPHAAETFGLLKKLNMNYKDVIKILIHIVEEKDHYTRGHSESVTRLAVKIAKKLGLAKQQVEEIREASLLHDIGKIAIEKSILMKPGPLTEEEARKIMRHSEIGARIIGQSQAFKHLVPGVKHHHEKYAGGGYPNPKMKKKRIPLYARIISVADSWDAMRSDRSYRKGLSKDEALSEMKRCSGTQFDPEIAAVFVEIVRKRMGISGISRSVFENEIRRMFHQAVKIL